MKFILCLLFAMLFFNNVVRADSLGNVLQGMEQPLSVPHNKTMNNESDLQVMSFFGNIVNGDKHTQTNIPSKPLAEKKKENTYVGGDTSQVNMHSVKNEKYRIAKGANKFPSKITTCKYGSCENVTNNWHIQGGDSLRSLLYKWTKLTGWSLVWDSKYDYKISSSADIYDDFISAVESLVKNIGVVNPPIYIDVYEGNKVIRVKNNIDK